MAYSQHNIAAITDVPALLGTFAAANGFEADLTDPNAPVISMPGDSNSVEPNLLFQIAASISGTNNQNHDLFIQEGIDSNSVLDTTRAVLTSPKLSGAVNNPTVTLPTKLHIFGNAVATDYPFLAAVIEYGFNQYRHAYFGKMEGRGGYTGREVVAACTGQRDSGGTPLNWYSEGAAKFLFSGHTGSMWSEHDSGGVRVIHAGNSREWRPFVSPRNSVSPLDEFTADHCIGGFGDAINDGYVIRGKSAFAGANILVPINLYAPEPITGDVSLVPLGRPPGVRMVNMQDLEPGASIVVGNETWRVFPALSKRTDIVSVVGGGNWPTFETSYYLGYAYLEEDTP